MLKKLTWVFPHLELEGGGTKFLLETAIRLNKSYSVSIVCNTANSDVVKQFKEKGVSVRTTSFLSANSNVYWFFLPILLVVDLLRYSFYLKDSTYIVATMYPSNFIAAIISSFYNKKYYYYCYEPFPYLQNKQFINTFPYPKRLAVIIISIAYRWTDTFASKKAYKIFTLNKITQRMIRKTYMRPSIVTFMGVDSKHFRYYRDQNVTKKYNKRIIFTHSTDYTEMKRTDLAIQAIAEVAKDFPQVVLLITSTQPHSPNRSKYTKLVADLKISKNVVFLDLVPYSELPKYYSASLCYLSCSFDEMLGTTTSNLPVKEALACETPAIRSDTTDEDVENDKSGFLVDTKNIQEVSEKMIFLIKHKKKAKQMGKEGRKKITALYNWDTVSSVISRNLERAQTD